MLWKVQQRKAAPLPLRDRQLYEGDQQSLTSNPIMTADPYLTSETLVEAHTTAKKDINGMEMFMMSTMVSDHRSPMRDNMRQIAAGNAPQCAETRLQMRSASPQSTNTRSSSPIQEVCVTPMSMHCAAEQWVSLVSCQTRPTFRLVMCVHQDEDK